MAYSFLLNKSYAVNFLGLAFILVFNCGKDTSSPPPTQTGTQQEKESAVFNAVQLRCDSLLHSALSASSDTDAALSQVARQLSADTSIDSAVVSPQGIAIQYASGMRGGIFLRPLDDTVEGGAIPEIDEKLKKKRIVTGAPAALKQAILWVVHYNDRIPQTNKIIQSYEQYLPMAGYKLNKNLGAVLLDDLCSLSTKDYIHLYSHGWAWPKSSAITDVYMMTNQPVSPQVTARYWDDIKAGDIVTAVFKGTSVYFVNSRFVTRHNTFKGDKFFYGGFCFSFLGQWPQAIVTAGIPSYTGFTWSVNTNYNAWWARTIAAFMADTGDSQFPRPMTLGYWYDSLPTIKKFYYDNAAKKNVFIHYNGSEILTLWSRIRIDSIRPERGGFGTQVTINGSGFGTVQGGASVTFNGITATIDSWTDKTISVKVPTSATSGQVLVIRNADRSNGIRFTLGGPFISHISPDTSHADDSLVITGEKFGKGGKVMFDSIQALLVGARWDSTRITVYTPAKAKSGFIRILAARENVYNIYDTSNAYPVVIAVPRPVITGMKPPCALADSNNYLKISGSWWRRSPTPNSFVKIAGIALATDYWSNDSMHARLSPSVPWGNQKLIVRDETVESNSLDVYIGIPQDSITTTALYGRCAFTILISGTEPGGTSLTMAMSPGSSITFTPVTWDGRNFSFTFATPGNDISTSFNGRIDQFGITVEALTIHYTRTNGDNATVSLSMGKSIPLQTWYRGNFTNQFSWSDGFQPPSYEIPRDSIPYNIKVTGTLNANGAAYTVESVTSQGAPMFPVEFKRKP
jgi:hypothetical protein